MEIYIKVSLKKIKLKDSGYILIRENQSTKDSGKTI